MIKKIITIGVLITTIVALNSCQKEDIKQVDNTSNIERSLDQLTQDEDFLNNNYSTKASLQGEWERVAIRWVSDWGVGVKKYNEDLPYTERWSFDDVDFSVFKMDTVTTDWNVFRTGTITPGNNSNVFFVENRIPDTDFLNSKFVVVSNNGIELKVRMKTKNSNNLRARIWFKKV